MEQKWILYQTTNLVNGKIYVGVHKLTNTSKCRQYLGSGTSLLLAIDKYNPENFTRETLAEFNCSEDAYTAEAEMVTEEFTKREDTYNIRLGGKGGVMPSEETRKKISAAHKGKIVSPEARANMSAAQRGKKHSAETKAKVSASLKGNTRNLGKKATEETKAKISAGGKGRVFSDEHKAKIGATLLGVKHHSSKQVTIDGRYYESALSAAKAENVVVSTVLSRVRSDNPKWSGWCLLERKTY
jgi:group I intron endonuclease